MFSLLASSDLSIDFEFDVFEKKGINGKKGSIFYIFIRSYYIMPGIQMGTLQDYEHKLYREGDRLRDKKDNTIWEITGNNTSLSTPIARNHHKNIINNSV